MGANKSKNITLCIESQDKGHIKGEYEKCIQNSKKYLVDTFCVDLRNVDFIVNIKMTENWSNYCLRIKYRIKEDDSCNCEYY